MASLPPSVCVWEIQGQLPPAGENQSGVLINQRRSLSPFFNHCGIKTPKVTQRWSESEWMLVHLSDTPTTEFISFCWDFFPHRNKQKETADGVDSVFLPLFPLIKYISIGH